MVRNAPGSPLENPPPADRTIPNHPVNPVHPCEFNPPNHQRLEGISMKNNPLTTDIRTHILQMSRQIAISYRSHRRQDSRIDGQPRQYQNRNRPTGANAAQRPDSSPAPPHWCPRDCPSPRAGAHTACRVHEKVGKIVAYPTRPYADNDARKRPPLAGENPASPTNLTTRNPKRNRQPQHPNP